MKRHGPARRRGLHAVAVAARVREATHLDVIAGEADVDRDTARKYIADAIVVGLLQANLLRNRVWPAVPR